LQGSARINFGHAVLLLFDATDSLARITAARRGVNGAISRRELALAGSVLEEGRLLVLAPNKMDSLSLTDKERVLKALDEQVSWFHFPQDLLAAFLSPRGYIYRQNEQYAAIKQTFLSFDMP
jgi:hypothetical protein